MESISKQKQYLTMVLNFLHYRARFTVNNLDTALAVTVHFGGNYMAKCSLNDVIESQLQNLLNLI